MNKRHALLLTALLGMATAQAQTSAAPTTPAPVTARAGDPQLSSALVTFDITRAGNNLSALLIALAKSAGYEIIIEPAADNVLAAAGVAAAGAANRTGAPTPAGTTAAVTPALTTYNFTNRPFNEVWPLLLDIYGLSYQSVRVGNASILRVSLNPVQRIVKLPAQLRASEVERQLKLSFGSIKATSETTQAPATPGTGTAATTVRQEIVLDSATMKIVAEPISNSIIIRGTNQEVSDVERLLGDIISAQPAANVTAPVPAPQSAQSIYRVKGAQADAVAVLAAQYPELRVTPVGTTGQLILTGPQAQIDAALALLGKVDQSTAPVAAGPQTVQRIFQLVNASAEEVKATLEGALARTLTDSQQANGDALPNVPVTATDANGNTTVVSVPNALGKVANQNTQPAVATTPAKPEEVTLIADKRTNTLIVRGTPEQVAQVAELIPRLDQVVPQINVQVRIQEITETASRNLGLNWRANFGSFNVSIAGESGVSATFNPTQSFMGFNIFPTLTALEKQGMTRTVYDGNVTMQSGQRSLNATGGAQNASSAAAASIKSGGRLEINIPSASGNIVRQIDYGLNLDFFDPQVAPDGTVTLRVRGQVNGLKTALSANSLPNLLDFSNAEAQSTITFRNGQTVLMSGLLGSTVTTNNNGVPVLKGLPVIGAAFGTQDSNKTERQLLVIITGTVVK